VKRIGGARLDFNFKPINKLMVNGMFMAIGFITEMRQSTRLTNYLEQEQTYCIWIKSGQCGAKYSGNCNL
jgi:hypothetical protein